MLYIMIASVALTVGLVVMIIAQFAAPRSRAVTQRLSEIQTFGADPWTQGQRRRRMVRLKKLDELIDVLGERLQASMEGSERWSATAEFLTQAGYRSQGAIGKYWATRFVLAIGMGAGLFFVMPLAGIRPAFVIAGALYGAAMGWVLPVLIVRRKKNYRQHDIQLALADALDLLVVCVEAGLGLNQALMRVADEIKHVSTIMSEELALVNLEIRAGTPRDVALGNLGRRTGVEDIRSLTTMLIQTDRFGTSIAQSLRVHSDTLRQKRRQRAEEAAAKTTIKMVFPLVMCIFPAMFVVLIGPGLLQIFRAFAGVK